MARQHVFPVCRPGARTYSLPRLSDLTLVLTTAFGQYYRNSDRSFQVIFVNNNNSLRINIYEGEGNLNREFLLDLKSDDAQALRDDLGASLVNGNDFGWVFAENLWSMTSPYSKGYEGIVGTHARNDTLSPGEIFCFGHKIGVTASNVNSFKHFLGSYKESDPASFNNVKFPFNDNVLASGVISEAKFANQHWLTLMWTGTRWVLLGSNNWY